MKIGKIQRKSALAAACLLLFLAAVPRVARGALAIDTKKTDCSMAFSVSDDFGELDSLLIPVTVYRIADVNVSGQYLPDSAYSGIGLDQVSASTTAAEWEEMAEEAARITAPGALDEEGGIIEGELPTAAGMLMFGNEYDIVRYFPEYFLDYRENPDMVIRWTDRLQSSSGEWSGNLFDFYFRVYNKIIQDIKVPFQMEGGFRIDDTPVHRALREALANCIINTDFYGKYGIIIIKENDKLILENPGYIRLGKEQMRRGGKSDPRNKSLMKMFNMIDIGEHAGSGVPNIFNVWEDKGWEEPIIGESFDPDRTSLILKFVKKQANKTSDKKQANKTYKNKEKIRIYLQKHEIAKTSDIAEFLVLSVARTRAVLSEMDDVEAMGTNRTRTYRLKVR